MHKTKYREIRQKLNFSFNQKHFIQQLIFDICAICTIIGLFNTSFAFLNILLIPGFMFRQFSILHEAVHGLSHPNDKINDSIGIIAGAFCLTPYSAWKAAHLKHHYWTGNLEQDPTFSILKLFDQFSDTKKSLIESTWFNGIPYLGYLQHWAFWIFSFKIKMTPRNILSLAFPAVVYVILLFNLTLLSALYLSIGFYIYFRFYEDMIVPQHVGLYSNDDFSHHPPAWDQQHVTRSWYMHPILEKYIVLNMNYHTEHHLFMDLPWRELKKAHTIIKEENEELNMITLVWMKEQRNRRFKDVITPVPSQRPCQLELS